VAVVEPAGLRERKRARTRQAIASAALALFDRQGFAETTIAQIAEAADVSPRTVSAYFPHKEELAFPDSAEAFRSLEARLDERAPGETAADALRAWIEGWLQTHAAHAADVPARRRVVAADEGLRAYEHRFTQRAQETIAAAMARDLGGAPTDLEPRMAAAATVTVFDVLGETLTPDALFEGEEVRAGALALLDRALTFIGGGIEALRAGPR